MKILVLGVAGMLGHDVFKIFTESLQHQTYGTARNYSDRKFFPDSGDKVIFGIDVLDSDSMVSVFNRVKPDVVVNCIGLVKQLENANNPLKILPINAMLPHHLSNLCSLIDARLIQISTDCVFSGSKGNYIESDVSDAIDIYGKSKFIGEIHDQQHVLTLRTSIIGHELKTKHSLVEWFLSQEGSVSGYTRAIFSGLPTVELARVIADKVLPNSDLWGLYHISSKAITKYELLCMIAEEYKKEIRILQDDRITIDRSLNSERFSRATGYIAPDWPTLIQEMHLKSLIN